MTIKKMQQEQSIVQIVTLRAVLAVVGIGMVVIIAAHHTDLLNAAAHLLSKHAVGMQTEVALVSVVMQTVQPPKLIPIRKKMLMEQSTVQIVTLHAVLAVVGIGMVVIIAAHHTDLLNAAAHLLSKHAVGMQTEVALVSVVMQTVQPPKLIPIRKKMLMEQSIVQHLHLLLIAPAAVGLTPLADVDHGDHAVMEQSTDRAQNPEHALHMEVLAALLQEHGLIVQAALTAPAAVGLTPLADVDHGDHAVMEQSHDHAQNLDHALHMEVLVALLQEHGLIVQAALTAPAAVGLTPLADVDHGDHAVMEQSTDRAQNLDHALHMEVLAALLQEHGLIVQAALTAPAAVGLTPLADVDHGDHAVMEQSHDHAQNLDHALHMEVLVALLQEHGLIVQAALTAPAAVGLTPLADVDHGDHAVMEQSTDRAQNPEHALHMEVLAALLQEHGLIVQAALTAPAAVGLTPLADVDHGDHAVMEQSHDHAQNLDHALHMEVLVALLQEHGLIVQAALIAPAAVGLTPLADVDHGDHVIVEQSTDHAQNLDHALHMEVLVALLQEHGLIVQAALTAPATIGLTPLADVGHGDHAVMEQSTDRAQNPEHALHMEVLVALLQEHGMIIQAVLIAPAAVGLTPLADVDHGDHVIVEQSTDRAQNLDHALHMEVLVALLQEHGLIVQAALIAPAAVGLTPLADVDHGDHAVMEQGLARAQNLDHALHMEVLVALLQEHGLIAKAALNPHQYQRLLLPLLLLLLTVITVAHVIPIVQSGKRKQITVEIGLRHFAHG